MILVRISSCAKSVLWFKYIILDTYHSDTLYLREQGCEDRGYFAKPTGVREQNSFRNTDYTNRIGWPVAPKTTPEKTMLATYSRDFKRWVSTSQCTVIWWHRKRDISATRMSLIWPECEHMTSASSLIGLRVYWYVVTGVSDKTAASIFTVCAVQHACTHCTLRQHFFAETSVNIHRWTRLHIAEDLSLLSCYEIALL